MGQETGSEPIVIVAELVPEPQWHAAPVEAPRRRVLVAALLFAATWLSVLFVGGGMGVEDVDLRRALANGPLAAVGIFLAAGLRYAVPLMTILICHEMGHFLQARRYGVFATYPYFIPMPLSLIGTFGAVIVMDPRMPNRRALFDIGISGPLAGLAPALLFCALGILWSEPGSGGIRLGEPLLFTLLANWIHGPMPQGHDLLLHPVAMAGWVGLLITSVNLMPIGQLDGGHVFYALLRQKAIPIASLLLFAAIAAVAVSGLWGWMLMLILLMAMGPAHPPTAHDNEPLGLGRSILGWLTLGFIVLGFTPNPFPPRL
jgi:membrane-associated protease RseP (regulator of RpoE activity)